MSIVLSDYITYNRYAYSKFISNIQTFSRNINDEIFNEILPVMT